MSTTKEYKDYILERFGSLDNIFCRPMMGGYLFYYNGVLFGGIYENDNFLIKKTDSNKKYNLKEEIPYKGGKPMYLFDDLDNADLLQKIVIDTCSDLSKKK